MSAQIAALRALLDQRFPGATPLPQRVGGGAATGIAALDRALPGGGLPRGRVTAWSPGGGATAVLRSACRLAVSRGERAAWVDGAGVVTGAGWDGGVSLLRPPSGGVALECAEELARSGGLSLVVVTGAKTGDAERVRLSNAAREGGGALVVLEESGFMAGVRIASRIRPEGYRWRTDPFGAPAEVESVVVSARVTALGWDREAEFPLSVTSHDLRLSLEPALGDRRGASR